MKPIVELTALPKSYFKCPACGGQAHLIVTIGQANDGGCRNTISLKLCQWHAEELSDRITEYLCNSAHRTILHDHVAPDGTREWEQAGDKLLSKKGGDK